MKKFLILCALGFMLHFYASVLFAANPVVIYMNPVNGSEYNYIDSKIIIRFSENINNLKINPKGIILNAEKSGIHNGVFTISDDNRTLIFKPFQNFLTSENVDIKILPELFSDIKISPQNITFKTTGYAQGYQPNIQRTDDDEKGKPFFKKVKDSDILLEDLPEITFPVNDTSKAYHGMILLASSEPQGKRNFLMMLDYKGNIYNTKATNPFPFNFKLQPNGYFAYSESENGVATQAVARVLDQDLNLIATYQCGNGYKSFPSEFKLLPNGHILMEALDAMPVNMRDIVPNGDPNANILGTVVQEMDKDMNVVFQWRSFDHTDITESYENLTLNSFRTLHLNAIEVDTDGNYLFSIRHFAQIMKVNRNTGEIMWRLGGKKNEFTFINEHEENAPLYFSYQHDIRRQPNGNITFFDNGNLRTAPQYSRAVEYKLDEVNKTATLVWEYRNNPDIYASSRGSVQILPNGNYLIGCGNSSSATKLSAVEVIPSTNEVVMSYTLPTGFESYRTFKIDFPTCQPPGDFIQMELLEGNTYNFSEPDNVTGIEIEFKKIVSAIPYNTFQVTKFDCSPLNPEFEGTVPLLLINKVFFSHTVISEYKGKVTLDLSEYAKNIKLNSPRVFFRPKFNSGVFTEITTEYNVTANTLTFEIFGEGEICIGEYYDNAAPQKTRLISPKDNAVLNLNKDIKFTWSPAGRYKLSTLFLGKTTEDNSTIIKVTEPKNITSFTQTISDMDDKSSYFWSVTTTNEFGESISDTNRFYLTGSFLELLSPDGGEKLIRDSISYVIKWDDNLDDIVKIELLKNDVFVLKIADSLQSPLNNIKWTVPATVELGAGYKIRITDIMDNSFVTLSENNFEIVDKATGVNENYLNELYDISLSPNPASDYLNINLVSPQSEIMEASVINLNGLEMSETPFNISTGSNNLNLRISDLSAGAYLIKFKTSKGMFSEKFIKR